MPRAWKRYPFGQSHYWEYLQGSVTFKALLTQGLFELASFQHLELRGSRKYPQLPIERHWTFQGGEGSQKPKISKESLKLNKNLQRCIKSLNQKAFRGEGMDSFRNNKMKHLETNTWTHLRVSSPLFLLANREVHGTICTNQPYAG